MNKNHAIKLARQHNFTKIELYEMLVEALDTFPDDYWKLPNKVNQIFDNGPYFNQCRKWINYQNGVNDDHIAAEPVVVRVLEGFGKFSKVQLSKRIKPKIEIQVSQKPTLEE